jgi:hypothetical protein
MVCVRVYTCTRAFCAFGVHFGCGVSWAPWMILGRGFLFCYRFRFGEMCVLLGRVVVSRVVVLAGISLGELQANWAQHGVFFH